MAQRWRIREMAEGASASTKIAIAIVVGTLLVVLAVLDRPVQGRYEFRWGLDTLWRYDTATGLVRVCEHGHCSRFNMDAATP